WFPIPISRLVHRRTKSGRAMAVGRQFENRNCKDLLLALTISRYSRLIIRLWLNLRMTSGIAADCFLSGYGSRLRSASSSAPGRPFRALWRVFRIESRQRSNTAVVIAGEGLVSGSTHVVARQI